MSPQLRSTVGKRFILLASAVLLALQVVGCEWLNNPEFWPAPGERPHVDSPSTSGATSGNGIVNGGGVRGAAPSAGVAGLGKASGLGSGGSGGGGVGGAGH